MTNRYILFQAYGDQSILCECKFALMQILRYNNTGEICLVLYTDNPDFFSEELKFFDNKIIELFPPGQITKWRGAIDFVHRVKIEILQHFFNNHTGSVLYCDTDTYCKHSLEYLFQQIENGTVYMHTNEGPINTTDNPVIKKWRRFLSENHITINGNNITDTAGIAMWNAGVIGINSNKAYLLRDVLAITDKIFPLFPKHTVEQFAFSFVFQKNVSLSAADDTIFHYWDLKEYRLLLQSFFSFTKGESVQERTKKIQAHLPEQIIKDKMRYKKLPFLKKMVTKKWKIEAYMHLNK